MRNEYANNGFKEADSSASIVLKSDREMTRSSHKHGALAIYRISNEIPDKRAFMMTPVPSGLVLQCTIRRDKSTFAKRFYTEYTLQISENFQFLATAKRLPYHCNSTYSITMHPEHFSPLDEHCIGQVTSNFWGSIFQITELCTSRTKPKTVGTVRYQSSCCETSGPRTMSSDIISSKPEELSGNNGESGLGFTESSVT